ncbi:MAG: hypothetical protein KUG77_15115 [Nannocystaceae bacterium]|nr:hypothetical protein [Nannocystaceae bacterium]
MKRDAFHAIGADLSAGTREKRRHFLPAIVGAVSLIAAFLAMAGIRADFFEMPMWRQLALGAAWIICGVLFPAVGVGLWFPARTSRIALAIAGVAIPVAAVLGWPMGTDAPHEAAPCGIALVALGTGLVGVGALSGAFAQRRAAASTTWVAAGLTLAALATTSWICPVDHGGHLAWGHILPGVTFAALALALGRRLHRRQRG